MLAKGLRYRVAVAIMLGLAFALPCTAVTLKRAGTGYVGPQGEYYSDNPTVEQLKVLYGK